MKKHADVIKKNSADDRLKKVISAQLTSKEAIE